MAGGVVTDFQMAGLQRLFQFAPNALCYRAHTPLLC
jgi:hypothetical protein